MVLLVTGHRQKDRCGLHIEYSSLYCQEGLNAVKSVYNKTHNGWFFLHCKQIPSNMDTWSLYPQEPGLWDCIKVFNERQISIMPIIHIRGVSTY